MRFAAVAAAPRVVFFVDIRRTVLNGMRERSGTFLRANSADFPFVNSGGSRHVSMAVTISTSNYPSDAYRREWDMHDA